MDLAFAMKPRMTRMTRMGPRREVLIHGNAPRPHEPHGFVSSVLLGPWPRSAGKALGTSARKRVEAAGRIRSMDVSVPVRREDREVTLSLRTGARPDAAVAMLLAHLGLRLPKGSRG